jgi:hypothetical protein
MLWLERRAWWLLLTLTALIAVVGLWAFAIGIKEDASVPLGFTGLTAAQLEAASPEGYRLIDFHARFAGLSLTTIGTLLSFVLLGAFREGRPWAWWAMWTLPAWAAVTFALTLVVGVAPGQAPPTPMISGPVIGILTVMLLLGSARSFFGRQPA